jgi:hypothetical protein
MITKFIDEADVTLQKQIPKQNIEEEQRIACGICLAVSKHLNPLSVSIKAFSLVATVHEREKCA